MHLPSTDVAADLAFYSDVLGGDVVFTIEAAGPAQAGPPDQPGAARRTRASP